MARSAQQFGNGRASYARANRWFNLGVLDRVFEELQQSQVVRIGIEAVSLDSTISKVRPDGTEVPKKACKLSVTPQAAGPPR